MSDTIATVAPATPTEARILTDQIKVAVEGTWHLVVKAYQSRAWEALGYSTWDDYTTREFGTSRLRLPREERQEVVASLREIGMSTRAIASATGLGRSTVARELTESGVPNGTTAPTPAPSNVTNMWDYATRAASDDLDDDWDDDEEIEPQPRPAPSPHHPVNRVVGIDGKRYAATSSSTRAPNRPPLPGQFLSAAKDLSKVIHKIEKLTGDDRFRTNRCAISDGCVPQIRRAVEVLQDLLDELGEDDGDSD